MLIMALVAYDNSDSSEFEDEESEGATATAVIINKKDELPVPSGSKPVSQDDVEPQNQSLFNLLPQPSTKKLSVLEEDDEFLHKKETDIPIVKPKAKITVPLLSDFRDVEDKARAAKPKKVDGKKSGLLSMLPQPRNASVLATTRSLIPHVLTQKPKPTAVKKKEPLPSIKKSKPESQAIDYSDDSDEEVQNDFFSINKPVELPEDMPLNIEEKVTKKEIQISVPKQPRDIQSYFKADTVENEVQLEYAESSSVGYDEGASYGNGYSDQGSSSGTLDEEAILKLCGTRGKRKREEIQIVDVNQSEVLADAREWLARGLTDDTSKRVSSSKRRGNEPTSQQKRKHQITYLAHQAKANEVELQNQWANNRMSKRQTQSKYGF